MTVAVRVSTRADRDARRANDWWRRHRSATELFAIEYGEALAIIASSSTVPPVFCVRRRREIRRVLMPRTRYHVYYAVEVTRRVATVLRVWGARRGRNPFG